MNHKNLISLILASTVFTVTAIVATRVKIAEWDLTAERQEAYKASNKRGEQVFRQRCMACHGNPKQGGSMCPPNYGSSEELLRLKVLEGKYPDGYKPKKNTRVMPRFPYLREDIKDLHEYLNH